MGNGGAEKPDYAAADIAERAGKEVVKYTKLRAKGKTSEQASAALAAEEENAGANIVQHATIESSAGGDSPKAKEAIRAAEDFTSELPNTLKGKSGAQAYAEITERVKAQSYGSPEELATRTNGQRSEEKPIDIGDLKTPESSEQIAKSDGEIYKDLIIAKGGIHAWENFVDSYKVEASGKTGAQIQKWQEDYAKIVGIPDVYAQIKAEKQRYIAKKDKNADDGAA